MSIRIRVYPQNGYGSLRYGRGNSRLRQARATARLQLQYERALWSQRLQMAQLQAQASVGSLARPFAAAYGYSSPYGAAQYGYGSPYGAASYGYGAMSSPFSYMSSGISMPGIQMGSSLGYSSAMCGQSQLGCQPGY